MNKEAFKAGIKNGIPIALGYLAVSFSLGIAAGNIGLSPFQGFITSLLVNASAGEYAGFNAIGERAPYLELILVTLITNARYLLMSFSLASRMNPETPFIHRLVLGFYMTDEYFSLSVSGEGYVEPFYTYGAIITASPCWAIGTALGIIAGNILPAFLVSALSVALYGMFLAVVIPVGKKDRTVGIAIIASFISSYLLSLTGMSSGIRIIVLTVVLAGIFAFIEPVKEDHE